MAGMAALAISCLILSFCVVLKINEKYFESKIIKFKKIKIHKIIDLLHILCYSSLRLNFKLNDFANTYCTYSMILTHSLTPTKTRPPPVTVLIAPIFISSPLSSSSLGLDSLTSLHSLCSSHTLHSSVKLC